MEYAKEVIKHISQDELKKLVRKEKNKHKFERLVFINRLYLGDTIPEACKTLCISNQTGYEWLKAWNEKGYEGLNPDFGGGRPAKITKIDKEQLREKLRGKNWFTSQVRALIKKDFGITYSFRNVERILRGFGMNYAKPYVLDYRKPENAEEILKESLREAIKAVDKDAVIGFMDEASPQTRDNRQRVWSFGKPKTSKNTTKYKANTFGFYPINGIETVEFMKNSKAPFVCEFLRKISDNNSGKHVIAFLDNARSHVSAYTQRFAEQHNITLVFIPKYSPDLNPIEFIWKSVRRAISKLFFIKSEHSFQETIRTTFHRLAKSKSFMSSWMEKFGPELSSLLCR